MIIHSQVPQCQVLTIANAEDAVTKEDMVQGKIGRKEKNTRMRVVAKKDSIRMNTNHSFWNAKNPLVANASVRNARQTH